MEKYVYKGKEEQAVLNEALKDLGVTIDEVLTKTSEEKGGLFSGKKVVIEIVKLEDIASFGKKILEDILKGFNLEGNIEKQIRNKQISYRIHSNNNGILIGKNGKVLSSIQTYLKQSISSQTGMYINIILDVENYKEKQVKYLERLAKNIAREVKSTHEPVELENMNSYERRVIHNILTDDKYVYTESTGEEPNRHVVIKPKENK